MSLRIPLILEYSEVDRREEESEDGRRWFFEKLKKEYSLGSWDSDIIGGRTISLYLSTMSLYFSSFVENP